MSLITIFATIKPTDFHRYMDKLDETELPYHFTVISGKLLDPMVLELQLDGSDHNGTQVFLHGDGTWSVKTLLALGSKP